MRSLLSKKILLILGMPLILVAGILILLLAIPTSPLSPLHMCTLIGCRDALELTLSVEPTSQYTVTLTTANGENHSITCKHGEISFGADSSAMCSTGTITFYGSTPAEVTIKVSWQGGSYSTSGRPTYSSFQPNGADCPPTCRSGKLLVEIP